MKVALEIRGKTTEWAITVDLSSEQIDAMRADGIEIGVVVNSVPGWIFDAGLVTPWMFVQDLWNFKNPFRG